MTTAKINFEMDSDVLANAQAFAARHRISLNKLVTTYFASLGRASSDPMPVGGPLTTLLEVSTGKLCIADAARELGLVDGGHVLALMRQNNIPITLGGQTNHFVKTQAEATLDAMRSCMLPMPSRSSSGKKKRAKAAQ